MKDDLYIYEVPTADGAKITVWKEPAHGPGVIHLRLSVNDLQQAITTAEIRLTWDEAMVLRDALEGQA